MSADFWKKKIKIVVKKKSCVDFYLSFYREKSLSIDQFIFSSCMDRAPGPSEWSLQD